MILRRLEGSRFSEVLPAWSADTVVIIAGGPSLTRAQVDIVLEAHRRGAARCIAVNDAYLWAPWADVSYAADVRWHRWQATGVGKPLLALKPEDVRDQWSAFAGQKCMIENSGAVVDDEAVHVLRNRDFPNHGMMGLSLDPQMLVTGRNSGFQALNLAVLAGAKTIVLVGFDGRPDQNGKTHFFGAHPHPTPVAAYPLYRQAMSSAEHALHAAGVTVLNATPGSAIDSFERVQLEGLF